MNAIIYSSSPLKKDELNAFLALIGRVFEDLKRKRAVMDDPVLQSPDYTQPFEVHTTASDYAMCAGKVTLAYESRKLNERRGPREGDDSNSAPWRRAWSIKTDNVATSDFLTQNKATDPF